MEGQVKRRETALLDSLHPNICWSGPHVLHELRHLYKLTESLLSFNITDTMLPVSEPQANWNNCRYWKEQSEGVFWSPETTLNNLGIFLIILLFLLAVEMYGFSGLVCKKKSRGWGNETAQVGFCLDFAVHRLLSLLVGNNQLSFS